MLLVSTDAEGGGGVRGREDDCWLGGHQASASVVARSWKWQERGGKERERKLTEVHTQTKKKKRCE